MDPTSTTRTVAEVMSYPPVTAQPSETIAEASARMAERKKGSVVVVDGDRPIGILTERDVVEGIASGQDPDTERVSEHMSSAIVYAAPDWSLEEAAVTMVQRGFRHLVVIDGGELVGILSMRDIVRVWTDDGASCPLPAGVTQAAAQ